MKKSELRNIIREIISQEVPVNRNTDKASYGRCKPIEDRKKAHMDYEFDVWNPWGGPCGVWYGDKCRYDEDCPENCWCDHPSR